TRARIRAAAERLGYQPNHVARGLSLGRTLTLGVLIPSLTSPAYGAMISGANRAAWEADYVVLFADTGDDDQRMRLQLTRLSHRVDGIVMASARRDGQALETLTRARVPFVLLNRRGGPTDPCVIGDDEAGVHLAVAHLAALGHQRIALITAPDVLDTAVRRRAAYLEALATAGLAHDPRLVVVASPDPTSGAAAMRALLDLPAGQRPTAVFCGAGLATALGALHTLRLRGLRVPAECSIVGFDDAPLADYLLAPLTTVRMPHARMGARAVELLLARIQGHPIPCETRIPDPPQLVLRASTAPPGGAEP